MRRELVYVQISGSKECRAGTSRGILVEAVRWLAIVFRLIECAYLWLS